MSVTPVAPTAPDPSALAAFVPLPQLFFQTVQDRAAQPAYWVRGAQAWEPCSWRDYGEQVEAAARALVAMGVRASEAVAILSFNRPAWSIMAVAAMAIGARPVGIYWTSSSADIGHILSHCQAPVLLVENKRLMGKLDGLGPQLGHLRHIVRIEVDEHVEHAAQGSAGEAEPRHAPQGPSAVTETDWAAFLAMGRAPEALPLQATVQARLAAIAPQDIGSLIYTSGTTGPAKAVLLSHGNLWWTATALSRLFEATPADRVLSYLPMAHIAEQMTSLHNQMHSGFSVYFASSMEAMAEHLKEVQPTIFFGVPRVWEKMESAIQAKLLQARGAKLAMVKWAMAVGQRWHAGALAGARPSLALHWQMALAGKLVHGKVKAALGFAHARVLSSGAAPIAPDTLRFFTGMDVMVRELYGQSEACGPSTLNLPGATRIGSVGRPLPGTQMAVAPDGELLVRGPHIFQGYLGQPQATQEALNEGWLMTGDLGHIDPQGFVYITGRKKDLIITSGGKNISPGNIEAGLVESPLIEHAVVCGDGRHYLVALLTLDAQALHVFAETHGLSPTEPWDQHPLVRQHLQAAVDHVNASQARVAHIRKFAVLDAPLSIAAGELTPTLKVRRKAVLARRQGLVDQLYAE